MTCKTSATALSPCQSLVALGGAFFEFRFEFADGSPQIGKRCLAFHSHLRASEASVLDSYAKSNTLDSGSALSAKHKRAVSLLPSETYWPALSTVRENRSFLACTLRDSPAGFLRAR